MASHQQGGNGRAHGPATLGALLAASPTLSARTAHIGLQDWQRAVGQRLATKTIPERLSEGVLTVRVPSSTWAQELSLLSHVVLERLQAAGHQVERMRFSVHATVAPPPAPVRIVHRAALPPALKQSLELVADPELRHVIAEAAAYSLARKPSQ